MNTGDSLSIMICGSPRHAAQTLPDEHMKIDTYLRGGNYDRLPQVVKDGELVALGAQKSLQT